MLIAERRRKNEKEYLEQGYFCGRAPQDARTDDNVLRAQRGVYGCNYLGYLLTWPIIAFVFIGAPALAFKAFSFLNKRGGSDVYHALPYTRTCVFISVLSSLFTGIAAVTAVSGVTAVIAYFIVGGDMEFLYATVLIILYCFLSAELYSYSLRYLYT